MGVPATVPVSRTAEEAFMKRKPKSHKSRPNRAKSQARVRGRKSQTKTQACLALLERAEGASIAEMQKATGWQPHSVRGFLAGTIKKTPGVTLMSRSRNYF